MSKCDFHIVGGGAASAVSQFLTRISSLLTQIISKNSENIISIKTFLTEK